jgi:hypothetical protein
VLVYKNRKLVALDALKKSLLHQAFSRKLGVDNSKSRAQALQLS